MKSLKCKQTNCTFEHHLLWENMSAANVVKIYCWSQYCKRNLVWKKTELVQNSFLVHYVKFRFFCFDSVSRYTVTKWMYRIFKSRTRLGYPYINLAWLWHYFHLVFGWGKIRTHDQWNVSRVCYPLGRTFTETPIQAQTLFNY